MVMEKIMKERIESFLADCEDISERAEAILASGLPDSPEIVLDSLVTDAYKILTKVLEGEV